MTDEEDGDSRWEQFPFAKESIKESIEEIENTLNIIWQKEIFQCVGRREMAAASYMVTCLKSGMYAADEFIEDWTQAKKDLAYAKEKAGLR